MSKKSLAILLLLPFLLSILFFVTSSFLFTKIEGDITNILWNYKNQEAFSLTRKRVRLEATPILADRQEDVDATLLWKVQNLISEEEEHAKIEVIDGDSFLVFLSVGDVIVTCTNTSGNVSKSFRAKIYLGATVTINTARSRSYQSIEGIDHYGMYDFDGEEERPATFYLDVEIKAEDGGDAPLENCIVETSPNIDYDRAEKKVTIRRSGEGYVRYSLPYDPERCESYEFQVIDEGYNVYSYEDLMRCTNRSEEGRIVCLQTHMESLKNTFQTDEDGNVLFDENSNPIYRRSDTVLFGDYSFSRGTFGFKDDVYRFESTYNTEYIRQYNEKKEADLKAIDTALIAGVRIRKDFYGNGFTINAHNLTYPTGTINTGEGLVALKKDDLFRGPLPFVIIGNMEAPIVKAYGQDNVGFYVDGDHILLDDVFFKNCDFSNILQNNDTTGTVVEVNGDDVTIKNSYLSSGRTVLRAFSTKNLTVKNSLLEKGREFIAKIGSNEYEKMNFEEMMSFTYGGKDYRMTREEFFSGGGEINAQEISRQLLMCGLNSEPTYKTLEPLAEILQNALNPRSAVEDENGQLIFRGDVTFEDTYFYQSGIFSIGVETQFNGPYLYDGSPVAGALDNLLQGVVYPENIGGISYPTKTVLRGDTRFYDYKTEAQTDIDCLVYQDVSSLIGEAIGLDSFFPIKSLFMDESLKSGYAHIFEDRTYVSAAIAKYGGGDNYSEIDISGLNRKEEIERLSLDTFASSMLSSPAGDGRKEMFSFLLGRCVSMAMGFAPFEVLMYNGHKDGDAYLFGEKISLENLRDRA